MRKQIDTIKQLTEAIENPEVSELELASGADFRFTDPTRLRITRPLRISGEAYLSGPFVFTVFQTNKVTFSGLTLLRTHRIGPDRESGQINLIESRDCQILHCTFLTPIRPPTTPLQSRHLVLHGDRHRVISCDFHPIFDQPAGGDLVQLDISAHRPEDFHLWHHSHLIDSCSFFGGLTGDGAALRVGTAPTQVAGPHPNSYVRIVRNLFNNFSSSGSEVISSKTNRALYQNNLFENCNGFLTIRTGNHCQLLSNRFENGHGGIRLHGTGHRVFNNLFSRIRSDPSKGHGSRGNLWGACIALGGGNGNQLYAPATDCHIAYNTLRGSEELLYFSRHAAGDRIAHNNHIHANILFSPEDSPAEEFVTINRGFTDGDSQAIIDFSTNRITDNLFGFMGKRPTLTNRSSVWSAPDESQLGVHSEESNGRPTYLSSARLGTHTHLEDRYHYHFGLTTDIADRQRETPFTLGCHQSGPDFRA